MGGTWLGPALGQWWNKAQMEAKSDGWSEMVESGEAAVCSAHYLTAQLHLALFVQLTLAVLLHLCGGLSSLHPGRTCLRILCVVACVCESWTLDHSCNSAFKRSISFFREDFQIKALINSPLVLGKLSSDNHKVMLNRVCTKTIICVFLLFIDMNRSVAWMFSFGSDWI